MNKTNHDLTYQTINDFTKNFDNDYDPRTLIFLEVLFEELINGKIPYKSKDVSLPSQERQEGMQTDNCIEK